MKFILVEYSATCFTIVLVDRGETAVGFAHVLMNYVTNLRLEEPYRRRGYGSALLLRVEQILRSRRYDECLIDVLDSAENPNLEQFYEKNGFVHQYGNRYSKRWTKACL